MAILHAMDTWRTYLIGIPFQIMINHHSLNYFLEQRLYSPEQHKRVTKMSGYDYEIIYKKGRENVVVDALSRKFEEDGSLLALSLPSLEWIEESHREWIEKITLRKLIQWL
jgi:hypothetical protein